MVFRDSEGEYVTLITLRVVSTHRHLFLETWMSIHLCLPSTAAAGTAPWTSPLLFHTRQTAIKLIYVHSDQASGL